MWSMKTISSGWILPLTLSAVFLSVGCAKSGYTEHDPDFDLNLDILHFIAQPGEIVESQKVQLLEAHGLNHPWRVQAEQPWVAVEPHRGEGPGQVVVSVRTASLAPGLHRSELRFVPEFSEAGQGEAVLVVGLEILDAGWLALQGPFGADVRAAGWDPSNPDRILVGTEHNHLFVSNDRGNNFSRLNFEAIGTDCSPYISDIQIRSSGRAYMTVYQGDDSLGGVYRSNDRGSTWAPTSLLNLKIASMAVLDDEHLLVHGDGVWSSEDGGESWHAFVAPSPTSFVVPHPNNAGQAILGGEVGSLYVTDGSNLIATINTGLEQAIHGFAALDNGTWLVRQQCDNGHTPVLLRSMDEGASWQTCAGAGIPERTYSNPYPMFAAASDLFVANGELYCSRDGGESFAHVEEAFTNLTNLGWIRGGKAHPEGILAFHDNAGLLWLDAEQNRLEALPLMDHQVIDVTWHALSESLFGITTPGGVFWMDASSNFYGRGGTGLSGNSWHSFSVDPRSSLVLLAGGHSTGLYRSIDGGLNWLQHPVGTHALGYVYDIERAADNPDIIWIAGGYNGVWVSENGGESFVRILELEDGRVTQVTPLSGRQALINLDGIQRIDMDTGALELLVDTTAPTLLTGAADGSIFYGHEYYNIHRSTDEGQSFVELPFGSGQTPGGIAVDPNDPDRIWLGYSTGLFESLSGGQTFEEVHAPFPVTSLSYDANSGILYVGTAGDGVYSYTPER